MCTLCMYNYYLYDFLEIIDNKKLEKNNEVDNDVYMLHVKRYGIRNYSGLIR
jgi:hypothetical protein